MLVFRAMTSLAGTSILVVDDDAAIRGAIARLLLHAGAHVRDAADGNEAIALATAEPFDLLLTDVDMPGRDGAAVALAVTSLQPGLVVVFMSGRSHATHLASGRLDEHDRLVEKPFGSAHLVATLATALRNGNDRGTHRAPISTHGDR